MRAKRIPYHFLGLALVGLVFLVSGCQITRQEDFNDDAYFSMEDARMEANAYRKERAQEFNQEPLVEPVARQNPRNLVDTLSPENNMYRDDMGNLVITNGYDPSPLALEDYHDYSYASRLRRFGSDAPFNGYYDPWYTNHYWYSGSMDYWGTSIYQTYPWWYQPGGPANAFGWGWGYAWSPLMGGGAWGLGGYNPWMGNSGWGSAWNGFYNGSLYYNSLDQNVYYGKRNVGRSGAKGESPTLTFSRVMEQPEMETARRQSLQRSSQNPPSLSGNPPAPPNQRAPVIQRDPAVGVPQRGNNSGGSLRRTEEVDVARPPVSTEGQSKYDNRKENGMLREQGSIDRTPPNATPVRREPAQNPTPARSEDNRSRRGIFGEGSRSGIFRPSEQSSPRTSPAPSRSNKPSGGNTPSRSNHNSRGGSLRSPR